MNLNKVRLLLCLIISIPSAVIAQKGAGIKFENNLTWQQILTKAKADHKFIFVDCFATWCGPCKVMDQTTYQNDTVGTYVNTHFIAVKVQMDTTKKDGDIIRKWHADAHDLQKRYKVTAFPTLLFFSPEGKIIHRGVGIYSPKDFIVLVKQATDPEKQYYALLDAFEHRTLDIKAMPHLAKLAKDQLDKQTANNVIREYQIRYLDKLTDSALCTKVNLDLANDFASALIYDPGVDGRFFKLFYNQSDAVDKVAKFDGFAKFFINGIITKYFINGKIYHDDKPIAGNPEWNVMATEISNRFSKVDADLLLLNAQITFYRAAKRWPEATKSFVIKTEKYGVDTAGYAGLAAANNICNMLLTHTDDSIIIKKAVSWLQHHLERLHEFKDTTGNSDLTIYGGFLYKAGRREEGIAWVESQLHYQERQAKNQNRNIASDSGYMAKQEILRRMKRGDRIDETWKSEAFL